MGEQLEEQYPRALGATREVLKFGAMLLHVREVILPECSQRENIQNKGKTSKGQGLLGWLTKYAPEVNYKTACRFMDVAEAIRNSFALPARAAKQLTFSDLVTTPTDELDEQFRALQEKIFAFVEGTSQKSWLDQFRESQSRGGDTSAHRKKLTPEQERAQFLENCKTDFEAALKALDPIVCKKTWQASSIPRSHLEEAADLFRQFARDISEFLKPNAPSQLNDSHPSTPSP